MLPLNIASLPQLLRPKYVFVKVVLWGATRGRDASPTNRPLTHLKSKIKTRIRFKSRTKFHAPFQDAVGAGDGVPARGNYNRLSALKRTHWGSNARRHRHNDLVRLDEAGQRQRGCGAAAAPVGEQPKVIRRALREVSAHASC